MTYTVNFQSLATRPTAFDAVFTDPLPAQLETYVITGVTDSAGLLGIAVSKLLPGTCFNWPAARRWIWRRAGWLP